MAVEPRPYRASLRGCHLARRFGHRRRRRRSVGSLGGRRAAGRRTPFRDPRAPVVHGPRLDNQRSGRGRKTPRLIRSGGSSSRTPLTVRLRIVERLRKAASPRSALGEADVSRAPHRTSSDSTKCVVYPMSRTRPSRPSADGKPATATAPPGLGNPDRRSRCFCSPHSEARLGSPSDPRNAGKAGQVEAPQ